MHSSRMCTGQTLTSHIFVMDAPPLTMHAPVTIHTLLPCMPSQPCMPPAMHAPSHAQPSLATHSPCDHACPPVPHMSPLPDHTCPLTMHNPLPHMSPWHACPPDYAHPHKKSVEKSQLSWLVMGWVERSIKSQFKNLNSVGKSWGGVKVA